MAGFLSTLRRLGITPESIANAVRLSRRPVTGGTGIRVTSGPELGTCISLLQQPRRAGGTSLKFGRAVATWSNGLNYIGVVPTDINGVDTGENEINIDISSPNDGTAPTQVTISEGDIIAYLEYPEVINSISGIAVAVKMGDANTVPAPTHQYQVLSCTSFTSSTNYTLAFDYPRVHG